MKVSLLYDIRFEVSTRIQEIWKLMRKAGLGINHGVEVSWYHKLIRKSDEGPLVYRIEGEPIVFRQKCSSASSDIDPEHILEMIDNGEVSIEETDQIRCHCHTHPGLSAAPSVTDETTFNENSQGKSFYAGIIVAQDAVSIRVIDNDYGLQLEDITISTPLEDLDADDILKKVKDRVENKFDSTTTRYFLNGEWVDNKFKTKKKGKKGKKVAEDWDTFKESYCQGYLNPYEGGFGDEDFSYTNPILTKVMSAAKGKK